MSHFELKRRTWLAAAAIALPWASGCHDDLVTRPEDELVAGALVFGFEIQGLAPCDANEQWWVLTHDRLGQELVIRYLETITHEYEPVYAELRGVKSERGEYGHLGAYDREFIPSRIVVVRPLQPGDCGA